MSDNPKDAETYAAYVRRWHKQPPQPSLFNFKSEVTRHSGLTPAEERELIIAAIAGDYPKTHRVERTGTTYTFNGPEAVKRLLKRLRFGSKSVREQLAAR